MNQREVLASQEQDKHTTFKPNLCEKSRKIISNQKKKS